ncbi:MAG TPA: TonB-dependent receptor, partial [Pyrinomonadaceae bacterium]|nr:TonB-dependent receptor [Pyrinomonadaceae bacterium]
REIPVELPDTEESHDVLATLWARNKIEDVMGEDMMAHHGSMKPELREEITQLGLKFKLMTQFTSFVAVDEVIFTGPDPAQRVDVPAGAPSTGTLPAPSLAGATELVSVMADDKLLNSTQASLGTTVTVRDITNLPINGRSFQNLLTLVPGTVRASGDQFANYPNSGIASNGQPAVSNMYVVDGVSANFGIAPGGQNPGPSAAGSTLALTASGGDNGVAPIESVQEMAVKTSYAEAEYGRVPGAQVNVVTRAGTNDFHGSLFHFFGNDATDASDWFANSRGLKQTPRRLNNFGGTIGGPIDRDEIFFFGSYEGLRLRQPMTGITDVPSLFSRTTAVPEIRPFLNAFPLPTGTARADGLAEFASTFANPARHDIGGFRLDLSGKSSTFTGKYNFADSDAGERGAEGFSLNTVNRIRSQAQTVTGIFSRTLSSTKVLELRANYSRLRVAGSQALDEFGGAVVASSLAPGFSESFNFDLNARGANLIAGSEVSNIQRQFNVLGSLVIVSGNHSFKFGGDYRRISPSFGLRSLETNVLFDGVGQAITGVPARVGLFNRETSQSPDFDNLSLYAQDEWRTTARLTLTYGLRWEVNPAPSNDGTQRSRWTRRTNPRNSSQLPPPRRCGRRRILISRRALVLRTSSSVGTIRKSSCAVASLCCTTWASNERVKRLPTRFRLLVALVHRRSSSILSSNYLTR